MKYRFHNLVCHNTYMKIFYNNTNVIHRHGYSADETEVCYSVGGVNYFCFTTPSPSGHPEEEGDCCCGHDAGNGNCFTA